MTLTQLAQRLDLSVTTVSRALAGYSDVAEATRQRVRAEAARVGYRPNLLARRLQSGRANTFGIVLPTGPGQFDDPFFMRLLGALGPALADREMDLLVSCAAPWGPEMRSYRNLVEGRRVDGLFIARTAHDDPRVAYLLDERLPFVIHGRCNETRPHAFVDTDSQTACRIATERLIGLGHRRIGLINAPHSYNFARHREAGWLEAMGAAGLETSACRDAEPNEENGFRLMRSLLAKTNPPTGVLCTTDRLAVGALLAINQAGLRPGVDVSVIGYDNLPVAEYTDPPLTTFEQPIDQAARQMVEMLLALTNGADPAALNMVLPARLIVRQSDGPAPLRSASGGGA